MEKVEIKATVSEILNKNIIFDCTHKDGSKERRSFSNDSIFTNDIKVGDKYTMTITCGIGWTQLDFKKEEEEEEGEADDNFLIDNYYVNSSIDRDLIEKCKKFAIDCHKKVNQLYDGNPYSYHLGMAVDFGYEFIHLIPTENRANVIGGLWNHDTIEDTGITWNDLRKNTNEVVANIAYALTNEKGKTRNERANAKYYKGIRKEEFSDYDKLCDRLANVKHSYEKYKLDPLSGGSMFDKYHAENPKFIWGLIKPEWYEFRQHALRIFMGRRLYVKYRKANYKYNTMVTRLESMLNQK